MITQEEIKSYIQGRLQHYADTLTYEIEFDGKVGFYDHKWVKENFGVKITPFCVTQNSLQVLDDGVTTQSRYSVIIMGFAKDRESIRQIVQATLNEMGNSNVTIGGYTVWFSQSGIDEGVDFAEGSGQAFKRFEMMFSFDITSMEGLLNSNNIVITYGTKTIVWKGFKIVHGKTNYLNIANSSNGTTDTNNPNIFRDEVVIEAFLTSASTDNIPKDLMEKTTSSGISRELNIKINGVDYIKSNYVFDGFQLANEKNNIVTVFLYFTKEEPKGTLTINNASIPIIDYSIGLATITEQMSTLGSNIVKNVVLGRTRAYSFLVSESDASGNVATLIGNLRDILLSDNDENLLMDVSITLLGATFNKTLLLSNIEKNNKTGVRNMMTLKFIDGRNL